MHAQRKDALGAHGARARTWRVGGAWRVGRNTARAAEAPARAHNVARAAQAGAVQARAARAQRARTVQVRTGRARGAGTHLAGRVMHGHPFQMCVLAAFFFQKKNVPTIKFW